MSEITISVFDRDDALMSLHITNVVPRVGDYYRLYKDNKYTEGLVCDVIWKSKRNKINHTLSCEITVDFLNRKSRILSEGDLVDDNCSRF